MNSLPENAGRQKRYIDRNTTTRDVRINLDAASEVRIEALSNAYEHVFGERPSISLLVRHALRMLATKRGLQRLAEATRGS